MMTEDDSMTNFSFLASGSGGAGGGGSAETSQQVAPGQDSNDADLDMRLGGFSGLLLPGW